MPKRDPSKGWTPKIYPRPDRPGTYRVRVGGRNHTFSGSNALADAHAWIAAWVRDGAPVPAPVVAVPQSATVSMLIVAYLEFAEQHYVKDGKPTSEISCIRSALAILRRLYGSAVIDGDFGPDQLRAVQAAFVRQPATWECPQCGKVWKYKRQCATCQVDLIVATTWSRKHCNDQLHRVRRCFRWGVSRDYTPPGLMEKLDGVETLREGRTTARESAEVADVPEEIIAATLPHLAPGVRAMVELQRASGMRPTEVCILRPCDLDRSAEEWCYQPYRYKTQHIQNKRKRRRRVWLGPKAREILTPFLDACRDPESFAFTNRYGRPFDKDSYRIAIIKACRKAGVSEWSPQQLRKSLAGAAEERWNLEHAKAALGHSRSDITAQHYSRADDAMARKVARELG